MLEDGQRDACLLDRTQSCFSASPHVELAIRQRLVDDGQCMQVSQDLLAAECKRCFAVWGREDAPALSPRQAPLGVVQAAVQVAEHVWRHYWYGVINEVGC